MLRRIQGLVLFAALIGAPGMVRAQPRPSSGGKASPPSSSAGPSGAALTVERQRLRTQLDGVNAEIDALKREGRGLRDDYRLRNRMADAEALARRLTDIDARLQSTGVPASVTAQRLPAAPLGAAPEARPSDDRTVLEAKADILADQARRLNTQAALLATRVTDLRARHELRRRAGQLERDPFSPLDQARRRLATQGAIAAGGSKDVLAPGMPTGTGGPGADTTVAPPPNNTPITSIGGPVGSASGPASTSVTAGGVSKAQPSLLSPTSSDGVAGSVATQFRGMLDSSTLAEIRRLELAGSPAGSLPAMERALSALRARAAELAANASALRNRAKTVP